MKFKNSLRQTLQVYGVKFFLIGLLFGVFACGSQNKTESTSDSGIQADSLLLKDSAVADSAQTEPVPTPEVTDTKAVAPVEAPQTTVKRMVKKHVADPTADKVQQEMPVEIITPEPKSVEPVPVVVPPVVKKAEEINAAVAVPATKKGKTPVIVPATEIKPKNKKKTKNDEEVEVDN